MSGTSPYSPPYTPSLSPLSRTHLPGISTHLPARVEFLSSPGTSTSSPSTSSPSSATLAHYFPSSLTLHKSSLDDTSGEVISPPQNQQLEHMTRRLASAYFVYYVCGWGDGVTGTILPYFEADFHLSYTTSSLLFAGSTVGFAIGTILLERVVKFLGRFYLASEGRSYVPAVSILRRFYPTHGNSGNATAGIGFSPSKARFVTLFMASLLHPCFFIIMGTARAYPELLAAYAIAAFARAFLTGVNAYVASTPKKPLGTILGCWSLGSFTAPLVCTTVIGQGVPWSHFYLGSLVLSVINTLLIVYAFLPTQDEVSADRKAAMEAIRSVLGSSGSENNTVVDLPSPGVKSRSSSVTCINAAPPPNTLLRSLSMIYQWAFSIFAWVYSGRSSLKSVQIVSYLLGTRFANPKTVGYVSSGFWGGMAVSRLLWGHFTPVLTYTQRKYIIQACTGVALAMHILIWFVNSTIENALSTAVVGLVYGPMFPSSLGLANEVLPEDVHMVSMAITLTNNNGAAALFPFVTGLLSNIYGVKIFTYVTVGQTATMFCLWILFPSVPPSRASNKA
ncbi:MFS general substrate transporter [Leucogyrophana mollusca]|uniref:MFS general substrate transporter n=1 Tax=Leucogyrophana mollusca TaxID=85980 RepID=A0ACB8BAY7_9AGAM|nr:MFS general substrate transporter [Leucogyrophana mollusca]